MPPQQANPVLYTDAQLKKLVEVIARSQQNYRLLIDNLDQAVFTLSPNGELLVANARLLEILGASFQELIGHNLEEFVEEPDLARARDSLPAFLEKGSWAGIVPVRLKRGRTLRYFSCSLQAVKEGGQVASISGWARDVTAQRESEIRFAELFECLREGIFIITTEGRFLDANPALVRMLGYGGNAELEALTFRDLCADHSQCAQMVREMESSGSVEEREIVLRRKDGNLIRCLLTGFAIRDLSGRVARLQGTLVDVTDRRAVESQLHHEQEFIRCLVASFPDIIAVLDRDIRLTFVSPRVHEVLGVLPTDLIGKSLLAGVMREDRGKMKLIFQGLISGPPFALPIEPFEYRARHADGSWRTLRASAAPLLDEAGKITGVVASARDVTEARLAEQELAQKEKLAAMGRMLAGAAHELNNPLTAILGVSDLLRERAPDGPARRHAELIVEQARRAAGIVQNLLAFSRPPAQGRAKLRLDEVVQRALHLEQASLKKKNVAVRWEAAGDLPLVEGDRKLLVQVFQNILLNAEQTIAASGKHGAVRVSLAAAGEGVRVTIADDGPGISPADIGKIFDPFFTTKRPGGGTGLGLTICMAVVKEHGGTIEVESAPGEGTVFRVLLPAAAKDLSPASRLGPAVKPSAHPAGDALRGHTVLVVDDEEGIREIVCESLAARGMIVRSAENPDQALAELAASPCEVVVCDFNFPGVTGEQLFDRVRAQRGGSAPRFVFMTGDLVESPTVVALGAKGARILQKPFHVSALVGLLSEIFETQPSAAG